MLTRFCFKLGNSEVKSIVETICSDRLSIYLEENPAVAKGILNKVVEAARAREAAVVFIVDSFGLIGSGGKRPGVLLI